MKIDSASGSGVLGFTRHDTFVHTIVDNHKKTYAHANFFKKKWQHFHILESVSFERDGGATLGCSAGFAGVTSVGELPSVAAVIVGAIAWSRERGGGGGPSGRSWETLRGLLRDGTPGSSGFNVAAMPPATVTNGIWDRAKGSNGALHPRAGRERERGDDRSVSTLTLPTQTLGNDRVVMCRGEQVRSSALLHCRLGPSR